MRRHALGVSFGILAALALVSPFLTIGASAQRRAVGGPVAPRISAPAAMPHFSAPMPRMSAPSPRFTAPATRFVAPRTVAPNFGVRPALPNVSRFGVRSPTGPPQGTHQAPIVAAPVRNPVITRTPSTVGQGVSTGAVNLARGANRAAILRNTAISNPSSIGANSALTRSTFRGRFAQSKFGQTWVGRHHRHLGIVIGFVGPVFWPYAYDDFLDYTFWPYAYDTFWPYAFDDVYEGIYGPYAPEYDASQIVYAYAGTPASESRYATAPTGGGGQICSAQAQGLTDFPIEGITGQVAPNGDQQRLLDDLQTATARAVDILQSTCPTELPSAPPERLAAMRARVDSMVEAVQIVRPALDTFYQSLSDEQKERFNILDQNNMPAASQRQDIAQLCGAGAAKPTQFPADQIARSLTLTDAQEAALKDLSAASVKAADILQANCQGEPTLTPTARVAAMEGRLKAMLQALDAVQPALTTFYGSLSDEQKARFNRLAGPAA